MVWMEKALSASHMEGVFKTVFRLHLGSED